MKCPHCNAGQTLAPEVQGQTIRCPACQNLLQMPVEPEPLQEKNSAPAILYCYKCGQRNQTMDTTCLRCGIPLRHEVTNDTVEEAGISRRIPYKNTKALTAYYCGVFALIPCFSFFLGFVALVFGILGLRYAKAHPEARGQVHAWIGIILGGLCVIGFLLLILLG
jgi:hypothetical protein